MHFEKVSFDRWVEDVNLDCVDRLTLRRWYEEIKLPQQGTMHSMGVDFYTPYSIKILAKNKVKIPTGIRWVCDTEEDKKHGLMIVPRSSVGIKLGLRFLNTTPIIDADYADANNEGHIIFFMENTYDEDVQINRGQGIAQGIIVPYIIPQGAESDDARHGGFGSTDNKN